MNPTDEWPSYDAELLEGGYDCVDSVTLAHFDHLLAFVLGLATNEGAP
jgi:hypothetical protein